MAIDPLSPDAATAAKPASREAASASPASAAAGTRATERWVNEGGSLAPPVAEGDAGGLDPAPMAEREKRDTADGCRDQAAADRRHAAEAGTANGRQVFERSAASWESRAVGIEEADGASAAQKIADRAMWDEEEKGPPVSPR